MSGQGNVRSGKCLSREMSSRGNVRQGSVRRGSVSPEIVLGGVSVGELSSRETVRIPKKLPLSQYFNLAVCHHK